MSKSKEIWKIIHRILSPSPHPIKLDPDRLNKYFVDTAYRTTGINDTNSSEELYQLVESFPSHIKCGEKFRIRHVTFHEVINELKTLRADMSTGPDCIPTKFLKPVAEIIVSPLINIINASIDSEIFPDLWKQARISPIPKVTNASVESQMRPISILPVLSKVFERLVHQQIVEFIDTHKIFQNSICGFRKGHSTATVLLKIKDDIMKAMKRGEVTLLVTADFSKAFDTIKYKTVLHKLYRLGFSKSFLKWTVSYLTNRKQFVQIDDRVSESLQLTFGVPQGSIMGPLLFNLYMTDLNSELDATCHQYADDTTLYRHSKPADLNESVSALQSTLRKLEDWSERSNLVINPEKTKTMLISSKQLSKSCSEWD